MEDTISHRIKNQLCLLTSGLYVIEFELSSLELPEKTRQYIQDTMGTMEEVLFLLDRELSQLLDVPAREVDQEGGNAHPRQGA